jgi:hypothetical protein
MDFYIVTMRNLSFTSAITLVREVLLINQQIFCWVRKGISEIKNYALF